MMIMTLILPLILILASLMISYKSKSNKLSMSPFECGVNSSNNNRMNFSLQFSLIALLFLLFDVESTLILPLSVMKIFSTNKIILIILIMLIITFSLFYEWNKGVLAWA